MPRKKPTFVQSDVTRALTGATAGGIKVGRVEIRDGAILLYSAAETTPSPESTLEAWKAKRDAR